MRPKRVMLALFVVVLLSVVGLLLIGEREGLRGFFVFVPENKVAVIRLSGPISEQAASGFLADTGAITPRSVERFLKKAERDPAVKAVVLRIDSPGGTVAASQEIGRMIKDLKKPLVISMGDLATSGGYYISAYADGIVAQPGTVTGSIGVIGAFFNIEGLLEKLGVKAEVFKAGKHKDMLTGLRPLSDEERALMRSWSDELHRQFIEAVAEGRKLDIEKVRELATGEVFSGVQAVQLGLVDRLGGLQEAVDWAAELAGVEKPEIEEYRRPQPSLLQLLLGGSLGLRLGLLKGCIEAPELCLLLRALEGWQVVPRY